MLNKGDKAYNIDKDSLYKLSKKYNSSSLKKRIGTSLFMILPPIGIFAAINFYKRGYVDVKAALYMAFIFTVFAYFTSNISIKLKTDILRKIFGLFTIAAGIYIYYKKETP